MRLSGVLRFLIWGFIIFCLFSSVQKQEVNHAALSHLDKAKVLFGKKHIKQAKLEVQRAISHDVRNYLIYESADLLYSTHKLTAERLLLITRLIRLAEMDKLTRKLTRDEISGIYLTAINLCYETKDIEQCTRLFRKAERYMPDDPQLLNNVGYYYAESGVHLNDALKMLERATQLAPSDGMIMDSLGWALYKIGRYNKAVSVLKNAVELFPDSADLRYHLGAAYAKDNKKMSAVIELNKALFLENDHKEASRLLRSISPHH